MADRSSESEERNVPMFHRRGMAVPDRDPRILQKEVPPAEELQDFHDDSVLTEVPIQETR